MIRLRGRSLLACALVALLALAGGRPADAERTLPLELAEIFPMSTSELLELAESHADFVAPHDAPMRHREMTHDAAFMEGESEAEVENEAVAEAEAEMEKDAAADTAAAPPQALPMTQPVAVPVPQPVPAPVAAPVGLPPLAPGQAITLAPPVTASLAPQAAAAPAAAAGTPAAPAAAEPAPVLPLNEARKKLEQTKAEILKLEAQIANQTEQMREHMARPIMQTDERSLSSGTNYWERNIHELKSSAGIVAKDTASFLTQTDARCVICQYVVQQAIGLLSGKPLTTGGATAGGKRAAAAAAAAEPSAEAAAFLEFDSAVDELESLLPESADPFEFLELDASVGVMEGLGLEAVLAAEAESTHALSSAVSNFLSAADAAQEHSAFEALRSHYPRRAAAGLPARGGRLPRSRRPRGSPGARRRGGRRGGRFGRRGGRGSSRPRRMRRSRRGPRRDFGGRIASFGRRPYGGHRPYMGPNLRNVAPITYPESLNDFGYENNARNRQADVLAARPRITRMTRRDLEAAQAKWDATRKQYQKLYSGVYAAFEKLCSKRMPLAYAGYCTEMMRDYRYIAQGIQYGDKAASICMNGNWCDRTAYIRHAVHAYFVREAGDN